MKKNVKVTYDDVTGQLTISEEQIIYSPGDWVIWEFRNIPPNSLGYLRFENASPLGPFHSLRSGSGDSLIGKGNVGATADTTFLYRVMLLSRNKDEGEEGLLATLPGCSVIQKAAPPDTSPDVTVTFEGEGQLLDVRPSSLCLNTGDTATWHFQKFPEGYFATLQFVPETGPNQPDPHPYPFVDFYVVAPPPGQPGGNFEAHGIGFGMGEALDVGAQLHYHVQVRRPDGTIASNDDPIIDNLGPPIPD